MKHISSFIERKTSWGIRVEFQGRIIDCNRYLGTATRVTDSIGIALDIPETNEYVHSHFSLLTQGIVWVSDLLPNDPIVIAIERIDFNFLDFQAEGFFFGIAKWLCDYFKIPTPPYKVEYDNTNRKYLFWILNKKNDWEAIVP